MLLLPSFSHTGGYVKSGIPTGEISIIMCLRWSDWVGWVSQPVRMEKWWISSGRYIDYRGFCEATYSHRKRRFWFYAKTHKMSFSFVGLSSMAVVYCSAKGLVLNRRQWMDMSTKLLSCHCGVAWEAKVADCSILYYYHRPFFVVAQLCLSLFLISGSLFTWQLSPDSIFPSVFVHRLRAIIIFCAGVVRSWS